MLDADVFLVLLVECFENFAKLASTDRGDQRIAINRAVNQNTQIHFLPVFNSVLHVVGVCVRPLRHRICVDTRHLHLENNVSYLHTQSVKQTISKAMCNKQSK